MSSSSPSLQPPPPAGATGGGGSGYSASTSFLPSFMIIAALLAFVFLASVSIHLLLRFLSHRSSSSAPPRTRHRDDASSAGSTTADDAPVPWPAFSAAAAPAPAPAGGAAGKKEEQSAGDERQRLIDSLPLFTMASALAALPRSSPDCAVCLSPFTPDAELRLLPACRHAFHAACVDAWLRAAAPSCPLCRAAVVALPRPSLSAMLAAAAHAQAQRPPAARTRDRSGRPTSFLVEMGTVSSRGSPGAGGGGGGGDRNSRSRSRTYSLGSFDYQIDEEVEAVVPRSGVARIAAAKEEKPASAEEGPAPSPLPSPPPPGETVAEAAGSSRGWLREYVDRLASTAYTLSERWSSRWSQQGQQQQQRQEEPWLWDAEMAAAPMTGSDEEEEETAFMAMYRWIAGV